MSVLAVVGVLLTALAPGAAAQASGQSLDEQLASFHSTVAGAVDAYNEAYENFTSARTDEQRSHARSAMEEAGRSIGQAFLAFEQGHGEEGSLSVFMQTQMGNGFYRAFEQDVVLLRATMVDAAEGQVPAPSQVGAKASPVLQALERTGECTPEGCGSAWAGVAAQSFFVLLREGFEAVLLVGAIVAYLHKTERSERVREVMWGVGAAVVATLIAWVGFEALFRTAAARGSFAQAMVEAATMLLASAILFYVGFWLLNKVEAQRWRAFIDGKLEDSLADDRAWMLALVGFLAVFREGVETVLFVQAIAVGSGQAWDQILIGLGLGAIALLALYYLFHKTSIRLPLRSFFAGTSAILCVLSIRFLGLGLFELQEAGVLGATPLEGVVGFLAAHPITRSLVGVLFGFSPTAEVLAAQALLASLVLGGAIWTFVLQPARQQPAAG